MVAGVTWYPNVRGSGYWLSILQSTLQARYTAKVADINGRAGSSSWEQLTGRLVVPARWYIAPDTRSVDAYPAHFIVPVSSGPVDESPFEVAYEFLVTVVETRGNDEECVRVLTEHEIAHTEILIDDQSLGNRARIVGVSGSDYTELRGRGGALVMQVQITIQLSTAEPERFGEGG